MKPAEREQEIQLHFIFFPSNSQSFKDCTKTPSFHSHRNSIEVQHRVGTHLRLKQLDYSSSLSEPIGTDVVARDITRREEKREKQCQEFNVEKFQSTQTSSRSDQPVLNIMDRIVHVFIDLFNLHFLSGKLCSVTYSR